MAGGLSGHLRARPRRRAESLTLVAVWAALLVGGCGGVAGDADPLPGLEFDFQTGTQGWAGGFADLPSDYDPQAYDLQFGHADLPVHLGAGRKALRLAGSNLSDDLFMFVTRRVDGLQPGAWYRIAFEVEIASNAPSAWTGIGGPPGTAVIVKAGAVTHEPVVAERQGDLVIDLDKGDQSEQGADVLNLGDIGIPGDEAVYRLKRLDSGGRSLRVRADPEGGLWVVVGTDSGFEGRTELYYARIALTVTGS